MVFQSVKERRNCIKNYPELSMKKFLLVAFIFCSQLSNAQETGYLYIWARNLRKPFCHDIQLWIFRFSWLSKQKMGRIRRSRFQVKKFLYWRDFNAQFRWRFFYFSQPIVLRIEYHLSKENRRRIIITGWHDGGSKTRAAYQSIRAELGLGEKNRCWLMA